jgi:hypothetical protein
VLGVGRYAWLLGGEVQTETYHDDAEAVVLPLAQFLQLSLPNILEGPVITRHDHLDDEPAVGKLTLRGVGKGVACHLSGLHFT